MENKKMSCWDFVFSSVKTHIDDLVRLPRICTRRNVNFPVTVP